MHLSSAQTMRRCLKRHLLVDPLLGRVDQLAVLDVGGADHNGSYRAMFERAGARYTAVDLAAAPNVDVVMTDPDQLPLESDRFHLVVSGQTFEHTPQFQRLFGEMVRVCHPDGLLIVVAPSAGPVHPFPVDCYRFLPDAFSALAEQQNLDVREIWTSPFGPFFDLVGVFGRRVRGDSLLEPDGQRWRALDDPVQNDAPDVLVEERELMRGEQPARDFLKRLHRTFAPRHYLEIGVWRGHSLTRATCPAVGVDPYPQVDVKLRDNHRVMEMTAEDFFETQDVPSLVEPLDLAYVDGLHVIEHALLDFMNIERHAHPGSVIVIDDISPNHPAQAARRRITRAWTGDVWKIGPILSELRPDLIQIPIDTYPTGSLLILGADPTSRTLWECFDLLMAREVGDRDPDEHVLDRVDSLSPSDPLLDRILRMVRDGRDQPDGPDLDAVRSLLDGARPRRVVAL